MFFGYNFPNRNLSGWNLEYKWGGTVRMHTGKNGGNRPRGSAPGCQNVFFVIKTTRTFGHLSCTDFDRFWNSRRESLSACVHRWKIFQFLRRKFSRSENSPKYGTLGWGACDRAAAQTAQLWAMGIISGASRHPKNVPFVREFWWGTYIRISPRKSWNFAEFSTWVDLIV